MIHRRLAAALGVAALLASVSAWAQTVPGGAFLPNGAKVDTVPAAIWGVNSATDQPCLIGALPYVANCTFPGTGGGSGGSTYQTEGANTAPAQSSWMGTYVSGSWHGNSASAPLFATITNTPTVNLSGLGLAATAANQVAPQGPVTPGAAPGATVVGGGVYNSGGVSLTNGQSVAEQVDAYGDKMVCVAYQGACSNPATPAAVYGSPNTACPNNKVVGVTTSTDLYTSTNRVYICWVRIMTGTAQDVSLVEGTGTLCATGIAALFGDITAAGGEALGANVPSGMSYGINPQKTAVTGDHICLLMDGTARVNVAFAYADAP